MISEGRPPLCNTSSEAGALESSIQKVRIENESDRRPTSDQPPTGVHLPPTDLRPTSDRPPTDLRPTSLVWAMTAFSTHMTFYNGIKSIILNINAYNIIYIMIYITCNPKTAFIALSSCHNYTLDDQSITDDMHRIHFT